MKIIFYTVVVALFLGLIITVFMYSFFGWHKANKEVIYAYDKATNQILTFDTRVYRVYDKGGQLIQIYGNQGYTDDNEDFNCYVNRADSLIQIETFFLINRNKQKGYNHKRAWSIRVEKYYLNNKKVIATQVGWTPQENIEDGNAVKLEQVEYDPLKTLNPSVSIQEIENERINHTCPVKMK